MVSLSMGPSSLYAHSFDASCLLVNWASQVRPREGESRVVIITYSNTTKPKSLNLWIKVQLCYFNHSFFSILFNVGTSLTHVYPTFFDSKMIFHQFEHAWVSWSFVFCINMNFYWEGQFHKIWEKWYGSWALIC